MCIAIYSPIGTNIPCEEYLKTSFENNPHGAGFAYNTRHNDVQIEKGFMKWEDFKKAINRANAKNALKDRGVLIHFRIQTHGGINPECCHPFPLVADEAAMKKKNIKTNYAVIHNGIISLTGSEAYRREKMSDTMVFIEKYLSKIATNKKWFNNKSNFELIGDLIDSKMAILNGYGKIHSTNGFTKDSDGNWYSNQTYKEPRYKKTTSNYNYNGYGSYDNWYGWGRNYENEERWSNYVSQFSKTTDSKEETRLVSLIDRCNEIEEEEEFEELMMLDKEMCAVNFDSTYSEEEVYEYDSAMPIFIDEAGNLWQTTSEYVDYDKGIVTNLDYIGYGAFYPLVGDRYDLYLGVKFEPNFKTPIEEVWQ